MLRLIRSKDIFITACMLVLDLTNKTEQSQ